MFNSYQDRDKEVFEQIRNSYNEKYFQNSFVYIRHIFCFYDVLMDDYIVEINIKIGEYQTNFRQSYSCYFLEQKLQEEKYSWLKNEKDKFILLLTCPETRTIIEKITKSLEKIKTKNDALLHMNDPDDMIKNYAKYIITNNFFLKNSGENNEH